MILGGDLVIASAQISNFFLSDLVLMADFFEKINNGDFLSNNLIK